MYAEFPIKRPKPQRSKRGCFTCRSKKKKCNEERPECGNCARNGYVCVWPANGAAPLPRNEEFKKYRQFRKRRPEAENDPRKTEAKATVHYTPSTYPCATTSATTSATSPVSRATRRAAHHTPLLLRLQSALLARSKSLSGFRNWLPHTQLNAPAARFLHAYMNNFLHQITPFSHTPAEVSPLTVFASSAEGTQFLTDLFVACGAAFLAYTDPELRSVAAAHHLRCLHLLQRHVSALRPNEDVAWLLMALQLMGIMEILYGSFHQRGVCYMRCVYAVLCHKVFGRPVVRMAAALEPGQLRGAADGVRGLVSDSANTAVIHSLNRPNTVGGSIPGSAPGFGGSAVYFGNPGSSLVRNSVGTTGCASYGSSYRADTHSPAIASASASASPLADCALRLTVEFDYSTAACASPLSHAERSLFDSFVYNYSSQIIAFPEYAAEWVPNPFQVFDMYRVVRELCDTRGPFCGAPWLYNSVVGFATESLDYLAKASWLARRHFPLDVAHAETAVALLKAAERHTPPDLSPEALAALRLSEAQQQSVEYGLCVDRSMTCAAQIYLLKLLRPQLVASDVAIQRLFRTSVAEIKRVPLHFPGSFMTYSQLVVIGTAAVRHEDRVFILKRMLGVHRNLHSVTEAQIWVYAEEVWGWKRRKAEGRTGSGEVKEITDGIQTGNSEQTGRTGGEEFRAEEHKEIYLRVREGKTYGTEIKAEVTLETGKHSEEVRLTEARDKPVLAGDGNGEELGELRELGEFEFSTESETPGGFGLDILLDVEKLQSLFICTI